MSRNARFVAAALTLSATGAAFLSADVQAQTSDKKVLIQVKEGTPAAALTTRLGTPKKTTKSGEFTTNTWSDGGKNTLNVVIDSKGAVHSWSHHGPGYAIVDDALAVMQSTPL